jgi:dienelactone hydrolase
MRKYLHYFLILFLISAVHSQVKTERISYKDGEVELEGHLAYDKLLKSVRGGVLLVHNFFGHDEFIRKQAEELAQLGYVVFALDMYGKGILAKDIDEANDLVSPFIGEDRQLMRNRAIGGLEVLKEHSKVDPTRIVAIGYGFGGTTVLELARSGAPVAGVISFYGRLNTPTPEDAINIKGAVMVLLGADDPFITREEIDGFESEMRQANVDWLIIRFGNAVHGFTHYDLGFDTSEGQAYNYNADKRSWEFVKSLLREKLR